ncbi:ragulator complex protein LAMTOR3-A [Cryptotermes secundus]|uniref:ragulator complex protein LAMTOR3-A n=1 Tax=Cryptotermes secundus TaxID=105785 RepID=UPI000CD7C926|nr:ragulator complex protein LAMTOR3-A [Cryptotermes secundus]
MTEDMKKYLQQLLSRVDGLHCILITDRDGVPVLKVASDKVPELATRPSFLSTFGMATDQGGKLGLGKNKTLICMYSSYQVVQINKLPLVISFIGSVSCNTGQILLLEQHIEPLLSDLRMAVAES